MGPEGGGGVSPRETRVGRERVEVLDPADGPVAVWAVAVRPVGVCTVDGGFDAVVGGHRHQYGMADLVGSPAQVAEALGTYAALGADRAYVRILDLRDVDQVELIGETVLPAFAASD